MESGPATLSGFRLDNSFSTPFRAIWISGIVEHIGGGGGGWGCGVYSHEYFLEINCVSSWYTIDVTLKWG